MSDNARRLPKAAWGSKLTVDDREPIPSLTPRVDPGILHQVLDIVPEAVIEVDGEGTIVYANSRSEEVFGYAPSELIDSPLEILIPRELRSDHEAKRAAFAERPVIRTMGSSIPFAGLRKNGTHFSADIALNPVRLDGYTDSHTFAFVRDVTHLRRLEIAERELLDETLLGIVTTLNQLVSLTSPLIFERTQSIRALVSHMLKALNPKDLWQYQIAAALSLVGCPTLPADVFEKVWAGAPISWEEERTFQSHPSIAEKLLSPITRLESVAKIVGAQLTPAKPDGGSVELGICLIQLAQDADRMLYRDLEFPLALQRLRLRHPAYHEDLLGALDNYVALKQTYDVKALRLDALRLGMILTKDLKTQNGLLIAPADTTINMMLLERIRNFALTAGIHEPITVRRPI